MNLVDLINYRHTVDHLTTKDAYDQIYNLLENIRRSIEIQDIDFDNIKDEINNSCQVIYDELRAVDAKLAEFKKNLTNVVSSVDRPCYEKSQTIYKESLKDKPDYILDRYSFKTLLYNEGTRNFFKERVKLYTNWGWPGLEIRPGLGDVSDIMVACDPLYLVDTNNELFRKVKEMWSPEYQRRLRYYTINESDELIFKQLPKTQFGLVVTVDFFNFRPLDLIERYLKEIYNILRPGGVFIFTYNNCDFPIGVDNFNNSYYCYTPGHRIKETCQQIGYKVEASFNLDNNVSWLEIRKPGIPETMRGGQTLGRIVNI